MCADGASYMGVDGQTARARTYPSARDTPMTRHLRREGVVPQRAADGAGRGVQGFGEGGVGCHFAGGDLLEEGVDAGLVVGDGFWHCGFVSGGD